MFLFVAQHRGVGHEQRVGNDSGLHLRGDVHFLLQAFAGIGGLDARLQRARVGIERGRNVFDLAVHRIRIRFVFNRDRVANVHVRHVVLVNVDQNPHRAHVGQREALSSAGG